MGDALPAESPEFFQLHLYVVSIVRSVRSDTVFALYSYDERPRKTAGSRHDMEEGLYGAGLGILPDCVGNQGSPTTPPFFVGSREQGAGSRKQGTKVPLRPLLLDKNTIEHGNRVTNLYIFFLPIMIIENRPMKIDLSLMVCLDFAFFQSHHRNY